MPDTPKTQNEFSRAPSRMLAEILWYPDLTQEDKQFLYEFTRNRFWHRRVIAYVALVGILAFSAFAVYSPWLPPPMVCEGTAAAATCCPTPQPPDVTWINTTLAAVVLAYYGASAARPGS